jgi:catechol 2,3-dioxygenase-like lactoylglutathione lyase family enzyme
MKGTLHHVEIYVSNLKASRLFWSWLLEKLGYQLFQEWDEGFSYKLDETYIVFVQTEDKYRDIPYHRCRTGLNHLAFHVQDNREVDEFTELIKSKQIRILYEDRHPYAGGSGYYALFFEDPDRMKVEIVADKIV